MPGTVDIHHRLLTWFRQEITGQDDRHLQTFAWMLLVLLISGSINLTKWSSYIWIWWWQWQSFSAWLRANR